MGSILYPYQIPNFILLTGKSRKIYQGCYQINRLGVIGHDIKGVTKISEYTMEVDL
jgi:hypothetical protein